MGCKPSTLGQSGGSDADATTNSNTNKNGQEQQVLAQRYSALQGVGQTERQIGKMQRAAMNNLTVTTATTDSNNNKTSNAAKKEGPKLDSSGYLMPEEVAKRTLSSIANREATLGSTTHSTTHIQVRLVVVCVLLVP